MRVAISIQSGSSSGSAVKSVSGGIRDAVRRVRDAISLRRSSLSARYFVVSLAAAILPLAATVVLYDRYAADLILRLSGQRVESSLTATASKLTDFLRTRTYQMEALADFPQLARLGEVGLSGLDPRLLALLRFEADSPDVYAVLFLDRADRVVAALPGQSAIEPEMRNEAGPALAALPRVEFHGAELIGPMLPGDGRPGWFLIRRMLAGASLSVALQVRLASLTELLPPAPLELYRPVLHTPAGRLIEPVGTQWSGGQALLNGPEIAPGWYPAMYRVPGELPPPGATVRHLFIALVALCAGIIVLIFVRLGGRIRRRVQPLVEGALAVGRGELVLDIPVEGDDEIATAARALNRMSAELKSLIESRIETEKRAVLGEFAAGVAHEVRNPLATIRTSVQALALRDEDPARRELRELVIDEIERINRVIEDLLAFSRPRDPERSEVSARDLLRRLAALAGSMAAESRITLSLLGEPDLRVLVDAGHAQQILMNLVLNAIQAMPAGGTLTLRAYRAADFACFAVADTGPGMSEETAGKVMMPFFTTKAGGTGLGLAVSRQLAELNGGRLAITSAAGAGTTVTLCLPLVAGGRA